MIENLRKLAISANSAVWWQPWQFSEQCGKNGSEFIAATSPQVVIELLDELNNAKAEIEQLKDRNAILKYQSESILAY